MSELSTPCQGSAADVASAGDAEDAVRHILERRKKCNASGQRGEDIELIRSALARGSAPSRSTAAEVA